MEPTAKLLEDSLLIIWNERDATKRLAAMADIYSPDIAFYEANDGPPFQGYEAINNLIKNLQATWHPDFVFRLTSSAKVNHQVQQVSWELGLPGQPAVANGMDIAITENGKIQSLFLLLNQG